MALVRVELSIRAEPEPIFEILQDHGNYGRFRAIDSASLLKPGKEQPNGVGALRELRAGPIFFREAIVHYEPPVRLDYLIQECSVPIQHEYGTIRLTPGKDGRTQILWESKFELGIPLFGALIGPFVAIGGDQAFRSILQEIRAELEEKVTAG